MNEEAIKNALSVNLKRLSTEDFNEKIIQQLKVSKEEKKMILFNQKSILRVFMVISLLVLGINLDLFGKLSLTEGIIGVLICMGPLLLIVYNRVFQTAVKTSKP